jgi:hypothetical protein
MLGTQQRGGLVSRIDALMNRTAAQGSSSSVSASSWAS